MPPGRHLLIYFVAWFSGERGVHSGFLPYWPIWEGVIANSFVYGSVTLVVWLAILRWRAANRERVGRCRVCGYDLAGLGVCPECGARIA